MKNQLSPARIMEVGLGFWASKTLLSALELGLFTTLADQDMTAEEIAVALSLNPRAVPDFPDTLVALGFLERGGEGPSAHYRNTQETAFFLNKLSPAYIGGILEMANDRLFQYWGNLTEALQTGEPQNEIKETGAGVFESLYQDPKKLEQFIDAMTGISLGNFMGLAETYDFSKHNTLVDAGGSGAALSMAVAEKHDHMSCISVDLPEVTEIALKKIAARNLSDRVKAQSVDFFSQPLPKADVVTMGLILHDWNLEKKKQLISRAYEALPEGGVFIIVEHLIDDARRENAFGLMMSLNMLIETGDGFDFTGADFSKWCKEAGFDSVEVVPLPGPASLGIARK